jgi:hypothetical protein
MKAKRHDKVGMAKPTLTRFSVTLSPIGERAFGGLDRFLREHFTGLAFRF